MRAVFFLRVITALALLFPLFAHAWPRDKADTAGPFTIVTHTTSHLGGWNEGDIRPEITEHYSLRYRGKMFAFDGVSGDPRAKPPHHKRFNAAITFDSPRPAVIVTVGAVSDPNYSRIFYLIHEVDGAPHVKLLSADREGLSFSWVDPPTAKVVAPPSHGSYRYRLGGGRLLLAGDECVLDTDTLAIHRFRDDRRYDFDPFVKPIALSPDRRSFVRFARVRGSYETRVLVIQDFIGDARYALPLSRRRQRFYGRDDLNPEWFARYFTWQPDAQGHDRLLERDDIASSPHRGQLSDAGTYVIKAVRRAMLDRMVELLRSRLDAEPETARNDTWRIAFQIEGQRVYLGFTLDDFWISGEYLSAPKASPALISRIAADLDAALASGKYDEMFLD